MDERLLPCPFCGSTKIRIAHHPPYYIGICDECKASSNLAARKEDAVYLWNKRAEHVGCYVPMHVQEESFSEYCARQEKNPLQVER